MTPQTLAEKLRILADAAQAGETHVTAHWEVSDRILSTPIELTVMDMRHISEVSRIQQKPATIKVGGREINAPMREMPKKRERYWTHADAYADNPSRDGSSSFAVYRDKTRAALIQRIEQLEKDAALGNIAMKFVDRAGDVADCDPADRICAEFYSAIVDEFEKHRADRKPMKGETP